MTILRGHFLPRINRSAGLEAAVSGVHGHVLPVAAMTAMQVAVTAHFTALSSIGGACVVVGFGVSNAAIAATAPAGLRHLQS